MHVRALRGFHHGFGVKRGQLIEVTPEIGAQLIATRLVEPARQLPEPMTEAPAFGPFELSPNGGAAGRERRPSSLHPAPAPKASRSNSREAAPVSSRSTSRGSSRRGVTRSTRATQDFGKSTAESRTSEDSN